MQNDLHKIEKKYSDLRKKGFTESEIQDWRRKNINNQTLKAMQTQGIVKMIRNIFIAAIIIIVMALIVHVILTGK